MTGNDRIEALLYPAIEPSAVEKLAVSAWALHKALPASTLSIVPDGAHSPLDPGMAAELVRAADEFRKL